jgi:TonB family protein
LRRLTVALVLSAVLHGALLVAPGGHLTHPVSAPEALQVRLIEDAPGVALTTPVAPPPTEVEGSGVARAAPKEPPVRKPTTRVPETRGVSPAAPAVPRDPTWYSARELDELPRPLRPIRPPRTTAPAQDSAPGRVVLQLAIDETGTVTDAAIVDADPQGDLAAQAVAAGRETRFRPGTKGGRIVKSRVLLELTFVAGGASAAP